MAKLTDSEPAAQHPRLKPGESTAFAGGAKTVTLTRMDRPYAEDLVDGYNTSMSENGRKHGLFWRVTAAGELKLDFADEASREFRRQQAARLESERAKFIRLQLEYAAQPTPQGE